ncbi:MAG: hypothetical protein QXX96_00005 [Candidatus Aenigmatarchaeota archaeon]
MIYKGNNKRLLKDIEKYGEDIVSAYEEIFGKELYSKVCKVADKLLVKEAFAESLSEVRLNNAETTLIAESKEDNMFLSPTSSDVYKMNIREDGAIDCDSTNILSTSCCIIFNDPGVGKHAEIYYKNLDYCKEFPFHLFSYAHEYNHFINYALQEKPLITAGSIAISQLNKLNYKIDTIDEMAARASISSILKNGSRLPAKLFNLVIYLLALDEFLALELEGRILREIGFDHKSFVKKCLEQELYSYYYELHRASNKDLIRYLVNWHNSQDGSKFYKNFLRSLNKIDIRKNDINTFIKEEMNKDS